jgi:ketosteroid isomerase-like protein
MSDEVGNVGWAPVLDYCDSTGVDSIALANRKALLEVFEYFPSGDFNPFLALLDQEVTFHEAPCLPYGGSHCGIEATKRAFAEILATFSDARVEHHEVLTSGEYCIDYLTFRFRVAANGNTGTMPATEVFRFKNGKIVDWRVNYFDSHALAKAIAG